MKSTKRKICFPITNRVHYARQKLLLEKIKKSPKLELQIIAGGSILLEKYAQRFLPAMQKGNLPIHDVLYNVIEGGNHITMAKTASLVGLEFTNSIYNLNPDIVLIKGDRFEQLAIAMVSAYLNKTVAHIEGGDVTGTIDESVRHAITKLAHIHFVTNEDSRRRVIQMGEDPKTVFNVGSLDVEAASLVKNKLNPEAINPIGIGHELDFSKPYLMVMYHPVTTETTNQKFIEELLGVVDSLKVQTVWFWPNNDAGTDEIARTIRTYREKKMKNHLIKFVTDILPEDFIAFLRESACLVGNSSSGIKEASFLGVPVVNIGTRQNGRLRGPNVKDVGYKGIDIKKAIESQIAHGPYACSKIYYQPRSSEKIVSILTKTKLYRQKTFVDQPIFK